MVKNSPASARDRKDSSSVPGSGRSPGGGHGYPLQYSCLESPMDREAWQATHRVAKSQTRLKHLSRHACKSNLASRPSWPMGRSDHCLHFTYEETEARVVPLPKFSPAFLMQLMQVGGFQSPALNFQPWCQAPHREREDRGLGLTPHAPIPAPGPGQ